MATTMRPPRPALGVDRHRTNPSSGALPGCDPVGQTCREGARSVFANEFADTRSTRTIAARRFAASAWRSRGTRSTARRTIDGRSRSGLAELPGPGDDAVLVDGGV